MTFLILTAISGFALIVLPIVAARLVKKNWQTPKGLFLTAGLAALVVEVVHTAVIGNGASLWPQVFDMPAYLTAIILGVVSGLFTELGRFLVLDRLMKKVRSYREGIVFGLGWGGVQSFLYGLVVIVGAIGIYMLVGISDLEAAFPTSDKNELTAFLQLQKQSAELMTASPWLGLAPVVERVSLVTVDVAMTLLILLAILTGRSSLTWAAVGFRAICVACVIYMNTLDPMLSEGAIILFAVISFLMIRRLSESFAAAPPDYGIST
jgi:uncharacterized membrane protein YhfC